MATLKSAMDINTVTGLYPYLCTNAALPDKRINDKACANCESQCAYGRRLLRLMEAKPMVIITSKLELAKSYLEQGMTAEEAATKAGYKSNHALQIALGMEKKKQRTVGETPADEPAVDAEPPAPQPIRRERFDPATYHMMYKCRLCSCVFESGQTANEMLAMQTTVHVAATGKGLPTPQAPGVLGFHDCADGSFGIADFQGALKR